MDNYGTCDIADCLLKLGEPSCGFLDGISMFSPQRQGGGIRIAGPAYTVSFVDKEQRGPRPDEHYIDTTPSGSILVLTQPRNQTCAVFGGIMGLRAHTLGAVGAVVDGRIRDLAEHRELGFPVFAAGTSILSTSAQAQPSEVNVAVRVAGVLVNPGDYIVGDCDGVVCIPKDKVHHVQQMLPHLSQADDEIKDAVRAGGSVGEAFFRYR